MRKAFVNLLLLALSAVMLALPMATFAAEEGGASSPGPSPKSWLANDIFHQRAHVCDTTASPAPPDCLPDNIVASPFAAVIRVFLPVGQVYERHYAVLDTEGSLVDLGTFSDFRAAGFHELFAVLAAPGSSNAATRGLYKFVSVIIGADGRVAFSDYFRFRVVP